MPEARRCVCEETVPGPLGPRWGGIHTWQWPVAYFCALDLAASCSGARMQPSTNPTCARRSHPLVFGGSGFRCSRAIIALAKLLQTALQYAMVDLGIPPGCPYAGDGRFPPKVQR